ncbi:HAD family hydrolase [Deinococcus cavernae]|uniref:HAD family hydrolase n=1 Tax=Deinococcus cavernae TaxID=2320857 RepID=A0A418V6C3_9DEIO|nr:HAD family hydrolase [Deinococcus cavernae]RJF71626.1 HAD family hydrolase [Deinococcus cavernae]
MTPIITLDLDGVLMQNPFGSYVIPTVLKHLEGSAKLTHLTREEAHKALRQAVTQEWQARMDRRDFVAAYHWDDIYQTVGRHYDIHDMPDVTALVNEGVAAGHVHALPGAHEALHLLRDAGFRTVALTNGYRKYQWPVLEGIGLAPLLDGLESPEAHGYAKPQPELFHAVGDVTAHFGDTLEHDILGANLAGVKAVWIVPALPDEQACVSGEELNSPAFQPFFDEMQRKSIYLKHHPEATQQLLTPWVAVRNVLDGARAIASRLT